MTASNRKHKTELNPTNRRAHYFGLESRGFGYDWRPGDSSRPPRGASISSSLIPH